jgi:TetR/AcrR family transcriptional regulator
VWLIRPAVSRQSLSPKTPGPDTDTGMTANPDPGPSALPPLAKTRGGKANAGRILDAALAIFSAQGFSGARIEAVAVAAGMSRTNLLYYFRTKDELYLALLRRTLEMWLVPLRAMEANDDPRSALSDYITRKLEYARDHPEASRLFAMEVMRGAPVLNPILAGELRRLVDDKVAVLSRWMAEGRLPRRNPHHLVFMIWATTQHYADFAAQAHALTGQSLQDRQYFADARDNLLVALGISQGHGAP